MVKLARHVVCSTLMVLLISAMAYAQAKAPTKSVLDNYEKGVKAIQAQNWQAAIDAMNAALAADPNQRHYRDGVFEGDYFPNLYLFEAYVKLNDLVNARKYYAVRGALSPKLVSEAKPFLEVMQAEDAKLARANADNAAAAKATADKASADKAAADKATADKAAADRAAADRAAADKIAADRAAADKAAADKAASDKKNADLAEFNRSVTAGNNAYNAQNWGGAVDAYTQAKGKLPSDFASQGLQAKLDTATKQKADNDFFDNAVKSADVALSQQKYADAVTGYTNAKNRIPTEFNNKKLQAKLDQANTGLKNMGAEAAKKAEIDSMVRTASSALNGKKWDDAIAGYNSVKSKYPAEFQQQNLQAKIDEALKGKTNAAVAANAAADKAAADKAAADKAAADKAADRNASLSADKLAHDGLLALLTGDSKKAAGLLEQANAAAKSSPAKLRSTINAYLAVAYATQSVQSGDQSLQAKAQTQYKQAQGLKLDPKLVSPQISKIVTGTN